MSEADRDEIRAIVREEFVAALGVVLRGIAMNPDDLPEDWHRIWPELFEADGAPIVPDEDKARVA